MTRNDLPPFGDDEILQPLQPRADAAPRKVFVPRFVRKRAIRAASVAAAVLAVSGIGAVLLVGEESAGPATTASIESTPAPAAPEFSTTAAPDRTASLGAPDATRPAEPQAPAPVAPPAPAPSEALPAVAVPAHPTPAPASPLAAPAPPLPQRPATPPLRRLASEELRMHLERGEALLAQGDLAAARLFFERVAEAGDPRGASGLARSHDPAVLARLPVHGVTGDPVEAERWRRVAAAMAPAFAERR